MAAAVTNIKNEIKALLQELQRTEVLRDVQVDDLKRGLFDRDFSAYPTAILTTPSIEADPLTNRQNLRTYIFEIVIIHNGEEIEDATTIEELAETILNKFDNAPSLNGKADGGLEPSTTTPEAIPSRGKTYIAFSVILRARAVRDLTF